MLLCCMDMIIIVLSRFINIRPIVAIFIKDFIDYDYVIPKINTFAPLIIIPVYLLGKRLFSKKTTTKFFPLDEL